MSLFNEFFNESEEEKLISRLKEYDTAYYIEGNTPLITDIEYDTLKEQAKLAYPENIYFQQIGAEVVKGEKIVNEFILGSLDKFKIDTINKWLNKYNSNDEIIITPKFDGLSIYCYFEKNKLILASTRGDGLQGTDITKKVSKFVKIPTCDKLKVRGEILLPGNTYLQLNKANRRNAASGIIGRDEITEELKYLDIIFYEVIECDIQHNTEYDRLSYLKNIYTNPYILITKINVNDITEQILINILNEYRNKLIDYCDIDGLVLTLNCSQRENAAYPKNKIAFKHGDEEAIGEVKNIKWDTTRTGKVVPVVEFKEPLLLSGAYVHKAAAYNAKFIVSNNIQIGTKVTVIRSGAVIPKIIGVL